MLKISKIIYGGRYGHELHTFSTKIIKKFLKILLLLLIDSNIKKKLSVQNINMTNLSLDELKLVAKNRNIKDYQNKSEKDLVKLLSKPKPKIIINKKNLEKFKKIFAY